MPVSSLYMEAFAYATENLRKVRRAIMNILPPEATARANIRLEKVEGHYGDTITIVRLILSDKALVESTVRWIAERLSKEDKEFLKNTIALRIDESGNLYLRFSKQDAYKGSLHLKDRGDVIKVKIAFTNDVIEECKRLGLIR